MGFFNNLFNGKTAEQLSPEELERKVEKLNKELSSIESKITDRKTRLEEINRDIDNSKNELKSLSGQIDNEIIFQGFGLYMPTYKFANSDLYKDKLNSLRNTQKQMISDGRACTGNMNWAVNNSKAKGNKMVKDMQKLLLRAFNVECDDIIRNVRVTNYTQSKDKIIRSSEQISKLGTIMSISISPEYVNLKIDELFLALDFELKKQEEKDRIRELKEQQREEAKVQKEIEEARKRLEKERKHYQNALDKLLEQIADNPDDINLLDKRRKLEEQINDTNKAISDVDYREANKRAGYVYIISNIGAFGENVYKIGMTRRLDPMERVNELGDASVPFNFDVHALIFTEDAPKLEAALHTAFERQKVNKINPRREFFRVSLDDIKQVVRSNFDKTVEWIDVPEAAQYRQSIIQ